MTVTKVLLIILIISIPVASSASPYILVRLEGEWLHAGSIRAPGIKPAEYTTLGCDGVWEFSDGQEETISFNFRISSQINLTYHPKLIIGWSSPSNDTVCNWEINYTLTTIDEDTSVDCEYGVDILDTSSTTPNGLNYLSINITNINSTDKCIHFKLMRDGNDPQDTINDDVHIHGLCFSKYIDYRIESYQGIGDDLDTGLTMGIMGGILGGLIASIILSKKKSKK